MATDRIPTGVTGLDSKMQGGFFPGSVNLITGRTGTGKSTFCSSFLYAGALKKEPGLYITTEEREQDIKGDIQAMFGWDLEKLEKQKLLKFISLKPVFPGKKLSLDDINRLIKLYVFDVSEQLDQGIKAVKARRVVIDSVSIIEMFIKDEYLSRTVLMHIVEKLKSLGVTSLFTGTVPETSEGLSGGGIIEYLVDGVIKLDFVPVAEEFKRTLTIRKMRRTDHSVMIHPFDIAKTGLKVIEIK
ncbi:MAG: AAA family ATPase [Candidatus Aenigmarchaeota archaeon]|nr:AAA family ATPase [Candidatus Aenigmarchaeota archaeon]